MKKTKEKILATAVKLYNLKGVADVSVRQIAKEMGISHGNLIYHYKSKEEIIRALHQQLLRKAVELNQGIDHASFDLGQLYDTTHLGFKIAYEFRFLFKDLLYIVNMDAILKKELTRVEALRSQMYAEVIQLAIQKGYVRPAEYLSEYEELIKRIKIYSDHWIASSAIYDDLPESDIITEYAKLLMSHFYPYLTKKGKDEYCQKGLT